MRTLLLVNAMLLTIVAAGAATVFVVMFRAGNVQITEPVMWSKSVELTTIGLAAIVGLGSVIYAAMKQN